MREILRTNDVVKLSWVQALLADAGIETVLIGPIGGGLHSEVEWVDIQSVMDLTEILAETAVRFCE